MRKGILWFATGCGLVCGAASGAAQGLSTGIEPAARATSSGCTVLLCLASPTGWASIPECVSPVSSFLEAIKKKKGSSTPNCPEQFSGVSSAVVQGERVLTLTGPDGTVQKVTVPAQ